MLEKFKCWLGYHNWEWDLPKCVELENKYHKFHGKDMSFDEWQENINGCEENQYCIRCGIKGYLPPWPDNCVRVKE